MKTKEEEFTNLSDYIEELECLKCGTIFPNRLHTADVREFIKQCDTRAIYASNNKWGDIAIKITDLKELAGGKLI